MADREKKDRADHEDVTNLIDHEIEEGVRRDFFCEGVFGRVLRQMDHDDPGHKSPDHGFIPVRIKEGEGDKSVDQNMEQLSEEAPDLQLIKFLELEDEVRDQMSQDQF